MTTQFPPPTSGRSPRRLTVFAALFALAFAAIPAVTHAAIPESEGGALIALYKSTNGGTWTNNTGWLGPSGTECDWFGVTCDAQRGHVLTLYLNQNNLTGSIPPEIGDLSHASELYLHANSLGGKIPEQLADLAQLYILNLSYNQLIGKIPEGLNVLYVWDLSHNRLSGRIPGSLAIIAAFIINLEANYLSGPIPSFSRVTVLVLSQNRLTGTLPADIGFPSLNSLVLAGNRLTGEIPASFSQLSVYNNGGLDLRWNGLWSHDPALVAFLNSKQIGGNLQATQTVPPGDLGVGSSTGSSLVVSWSPTLYQADVGGYQVFVASQKRGPFTLAGTVPSKALGWYQVTGLQPGTTYYFYVCSSTLAHPYNPTDLMSPPSAVVSGTTLPW